jgi:CHAT domain-containing protein
MRRIRVSMLFAAAALLLYGTGCDAGSRDSTTRSPFFAADSLRDERRFSQAHPEYRRLRDSFAVARDTAGWWRAQLWWAQTLMRLARTDSSEAAIREAFQLAGSDSSRHAWTYLMRCGLWSRLGRSAEAIADCERAQGLAERLGAGDLQARVHFQLGTVYSRRGLFRRSVQEAERALALERQYGRSPHALAGALNSMGVEYAAVGRLTEAAAAYEEGLGITRRVSDTSTGGYLISNLAALRSYTGRLDQAVDLMTQSLASARALGDTASMVYAHNSLAEYLLKANNVAAAREQVERSLAISARSPAIYRVIALIDLGLIAMAEGDLDSAAATFERALPPAVSGGFAFERFRILAAQVRLAVGRGDRMAARRLVTMAKTVADSLGAPDAELDVLALLGSVAELERRPDASRFFLQGIELLESWRGRLAMGDLKLGITEPKWRVYEGAIRTLFDRGNAAAAFQVAERARARMLLEVMAERNVAREASPEAALKQRLRQRFEEAEAGGDSSQKRIVAAELAALRDSLESLEASTAPGDPRATMRHPSPAPLAEIRARLLGRPDVAVFSVFWGDSAVYGWWVTDSDIRGLRLGDADSLDAAVDFLRRTIERPGDSVWRAAAARVYQQILSPLSPAGASTIVAILDGPLARIPLEVLIPAPNAPPLGATHRIVYGPSASVLTALARTRPPVRWERTMLAVGNPRGSTFPAAESVASRAERGPEINLPYAEEEAKTLRDLYRSAGADLLVGRAVTVDRWLALRPERYRYLHFATHANVNDREPDHSRLVLADGMLDLPAIRRLDLTAELVTLSACETALGRRVRGEGVVGLSHAFLSAGARSTLVTLWPVTDRSTLRFMTDMYRELHGGRPPAEALRSVRKRWVEADTVTSHPAYWAPFILLGDPTAPPM